VDTGLAGKVVLITGAARGLGRQAAEAFACEGARIAVLDSSEEGSALAAEELSEITETYRLTADVSREDSVEKAVSSLLKQWKTIDVLIHCAGIARGPEQKGPDGWLPMEQVALDDWQRVLSVNLTGTFLLNRAAARSMIDQRWGRIVNVASISAMVANRGLAGLGPYAASKGGVISLTKVLAVEWAAYGITVNSISPGYMATEMGVRSQTMPGFKELQLSLIPQGRLGDPDEFAAAAMFLASAQAGHITGHNLVIDGGYTAW
jgi:sorbose reductase